ncbi:MAG: aminotransferase class V-fold PLP-dependent enzyme [Alphaproteobacteria bacterium]|nr:aminotransferase class V-fold PLP-dependent enzyme [Alphaproteobacteria bacterium]
MELSRREALLGMVGMAATFAAPRLATGNTLGGATPLPTPEWDNLKTHFLIDPNLTYLNTGSLGAVPKIVLEKVAAESRALEQNPADNQYQLFTEKLFAVKRAVADFINCKTDELVMTGGTTDGMALLMEALPLEPGQRVLITDKEYGRIREYWEYYCRRAGATLDIVKLPLLPRDEAEIVTLVAAAIRPETRALCISHVTTANGVRLPVKAIGEAIKHTDCLLLVDGAQAVGAIEVDVQALGCDAYAASGHKWLLGPKGTGFLYVAERAKQSFPSPKLSGGYGDRANTISAQNLPNIIGLGASLEWLAKLDHAKRHERLKLLRSNLYNRLAALECLELLSPPSESPLSSPLVALRLRDPAKRKGILAAASKKGISVKTMGEQQAVDLRVGCHIYNNEQNIVRFIDFLIESC